MTVFLVTFGIVFVLAFVAVIALGSFVEPRIGFVFASSLVLALVSGLMATGAWTVVSDLL
jgi:hypothetical protein